ncbi:MAG: glycosyltransferase [Actinomycetota bacterium]
MLAIASALKERGHDVVVVLEEQHRVAAEGFEFVSFPEIGPIDRSEFRPFEIAGRIAVSFAPVLDRIKPDCAVVDIITLGVALACDMRGIPWSSVFVHPIHLPSESLPPFGQGKRPAKTAWGRFIQAQARKRQLVDFQHGANDCNALRSTLGLPRIERIDVAFSQDLWLVATAAALEPPRIDWPSQAQVVGPCLFEPPSVDPGDPDGDGPLVLIAASTAHEGRLASAAIDAVSSLNARAIVTAGATHVESTSSPSIRIVADAPHGAIAARADAIICNGGHGIVARALSAGVPLVVLPQHGDQKENGSRAEQCGAAIMIRSEKQLRSALRAVLRKPAFREAAQRVRDSLKKVNGPVRAAELIEEWMQKLREAGWCPPPSRTEV